MSDHRFNPVEACIYCGSKAYAKDSRRHLAEEHIIPFGLNGSYVLPRASCRSCERVTGRFEALLLKGSLLGCRSILGLNTRSPKDRPKQLPIFDPKTTPNRKIMVNIEDYPIHLLLLYLDAPAVLTVQQPCAAQVFTHFFRQIDHSLIKRFYGLSEFALSSLDMRALTAVLAKIGHSFAVAKFGLGSFRPFLLDFILSSPDQAYSEYVGGSLDIQSKTNNLHELSFETHETLVIVGIRLFSNLGAPYYRVVVGEKC